MAKLEDEIRDASRGRLVPSDIGSRDSLKEKHRTETERRFDRIAKDKEKDLGSAALYARGSAKETPEDLGYSIG